MLYHITLTIYTGHGKLGSLIQLFVERYSFRKYAAMMPMTASKSKLLNNNYYILFKM